MQNMKQIDKILNKDKKFPNEKRLKENSGYQTEIKS
jgi:hypothetical protein